MSRLKQLEADWRQRQRKWRKRQRAFREQIVGLKDRITELEVRNDRLQAEHEQRHREQVKNWQLYDKAYAETSEQEQALFKASPAYQKYQQWRQTR